jgi:hypothetical protein
MALSGGQAIDSWALARALEAQVAHARADELDYRTWLLVRDSLDVLTRQWGDKKLEKWLGMCAGGEVLRQIRRSELGAAGFPSLEHRVMETTKPDIVMQFLRELGLRCPQSTRIEVGGSIALILAGVLTRRTEDLDVADEVPESLRIQHDMLRELANRYSLRLTHFQSHYLPDNWKFRLRPLGTFGGLEVLLVDPCDVFVSKLFSARVKDRDDLHVLAGRLDKASIEERVRQSAGPLLAEPELARHATDNWYVLYGQTLPR